MLKTSEFSNIKIPLVNITFGKSRHHGSSEIFKRKRAQRDMTAMRSGRENPKQLANYKHVYICTRYQNFIGDSCQHAHKPVRVHIRICLHGV